MTRPKIGPVVVPDEDNRAGLHIHREGNAYYARMSEHGPNIAKLELVPGEVGSVSAVFTYYRRDASLERPAREALQAAQQQDWLAEAKPVMSEQVGDASE
jgi:hypothetical protein